MALDTGIQWTHASFSPWIGCAKVSAGCKFCYAENETPARVSRANGVELWGVDGQRKIASDNYWKQPLLWNKWASEGVCLTCKGKGSVKGQPCPPCDSTGRVDPYRLRVFPSQCDVFEDRNELLAPRLRLLDLIRQTQNLDWLLLTKRPENIDRLLTETARIVPGHCDTWDDVMFWLSEWACGKPPQNIWLGVSVENQEMANQRIPELLKVPAMLRFLSVEPLLGPVEFSDVTRRSDAVKVLGQRALSGIHWVIVGGESGPNARECSLDWIHSLTEQCGAAEVPVFVKQLGAKPYYLDKETKEKVRFEIRDKKGGDIRDFPCHFHRDFPEIAGGMHE